MAYTSGNMTAHDGLSLHTHDWAIDNAKADILFCHGFFEHSGRYHDEAKRFNKEGYNFYSYDQRTHGLSEGKLRAFISDPKTYMQDYLLFIQNHLAQCKKPFFLFAHSFGGQVLVASLLEQKFSHPLFKGVILSSPLLMVPKNTSPFLKKISAVLGTLFPKMKTIKIDSSAISREPDEVKKYIDDPLNYTDKFYAASGYHMLRMTKELAPRLVDFTYPFIVLYGTADRIVEPEGSQLLYQHASSEDKESVALDGYYHEIMKDKDNQIVFDHILRWIKARA